MHSNNEDMSLFLSSDPKPRLKWTPQLHQRFVEAVIQLGGPEKATPKSLMRVMGIHGLTLYHLKSHLQKYRLGKTQPSESLSQDTQETNGGDHKRNHFVSDYNDEAQHQIKESLKITQALQIQMEVQRKLHEQIEVQKHLQLRIEAQGKYLQSVLKKAQDTLAVYSSSSLEVEEAKAELSQLVSLIDTTTTSSISILTDINGGSNSEKNSPLGTTCSIESSLTLSVSNNNTNEEVERKRRLFSLMEMQPRDDEKDNSRKRSGSTISDGNCMEMKQAMSKRSPSVRSSGVLDLNSCGYTNEFDMCSKGMIDLNSLGIEHVNEHH